MKREDESPESYKEDMKPKVIWPENPLRPKPQPKREAKVVDWLKEQRYKNHERSRLNQTVDYGEDE